MKRIAIVVLLFLMLRPVFSNVFLYKIKKGKKQDFVQWNIVHKENGAIELTSLNKMDGASHYLVCDSCLHTIEWQFTKHLQKTEYKVRQEGKTLVLDGSINGKEIHKKYDCEGLNWYQFHAISLPQYLDSNFVDINFVSIRPDDGKLFKLTARNAGAEEIIINGEKTSAIEVDIYVRGMLSNIGHVSYWFRSSDHVFIKYKGISGFPGIPAVTYELIKTEP